MVAVGIIISLAFIGWLIWRIAKKRPIKAYMVMYGLSCLAGIFTFAFFLSMDLPEMVKILVSAACQARSALASLSFFEQFLYFGSYSF